jgi:hypothetical protein
LGVSFGAPVILVMILVACLVLNGVVASRWVGKLAKSKLQEMKMNFKPLSKLNMIIAMILFSVLVACASSPEAQENEDTGNLEEGNGTLVMVDSVTVEQRDNHYYAVIDGNYPDPCTFVSSVEQTVEGNTISITLLTDRPPDLMCAAVLTPFTIDVLLTTGGLLPGDYTVVVNDGPSATFSLG